jgi:hypothetical protein
MAASVTGAEAYFSPNNHIQAASWARFSGEGQKAGAIAQAKRILNRACARDDIETDIETTVEINPEYAIYEQALHMLQNMPYANTDGSFAVVEASDPTSPTKGRVPDARAIAPEALAWLTESGGVELSRG